MKQKISTQIIFILVVVILQFPTSIFAQGFGSPLTMQGVDHFIEQSAASRSMGGLTIGIKNDAGLMFSNPSSLQSLKNIQVSIGALQQYSDAKQTQQ